MTLFNYYPGNIRINKALGVISLDTFLSKIKNPRPEILNKINQLRSTKDADLKERIKRSLYYFTPAVGPVNLRRYNCIETFTGIAVLDFDKVDDPAYIKNVLFKSYSCVIASWYSSSGRGVRALIKIPVVESVDEFKSYFNGFKEEISGLFPGFDSAPQNPVLPLFISVDPEILIRNDATTWTTKQKPAEKISIPKPVPLPHNYESTDANNRANEIIRRKIESIGPPGHTQLRAICYAAGGYIAAGYINESETIDMIETLIRHNNYLNQREKVEGYIKTANTMIKQGKEKSLNFV